MGYSQYPASGSGSIPTYANFGSLPASAADGAVAVTLDTDQIYVFNLSTTTWLPTGGPSVPLNVGALDAASANAKALTIGSNTVYAQSAGPTFPGVVNSGSQTFSGVKTFNSSPVIATLGTAPVKSVAGSLVSGSISLSGEVSGNLPLSQTSGSISLVNQVVGNLPLTQTSGSLSQSQLGFVIANGSTSGATLVGALDSVAASGNGAVIGSATLFLQSASALNPGLVSSASQNFGGNKFFLGTVGVGTGSVSSQLDIHAQSGQLIQATNVGSQSAAGGGNVGVYSDPGGALLSGSRLGFFGLGGTSDGTHTLNNGAAVQAFATENWGVGARGSKLTFYTTPNATTGVQLATTIDQDKKLSHLGSASFQGLQVSAQVKTDAAGNLSTASVSASNDITGVLPVANSQPLNALVGSVSLVNQVTGNLPVSQTSGSLSLTQMGFALLTNPMTTSGDIIVGSGSGVAARLAGSTSNSVSFLTSQATAGVANIPSWQVFKPPTIQFLTSGSGTYTTAVGARYLRILMVGGGGGGGGGGTGTATAGTTGSSSTFGVTTLIAGGGKGGAAIGGIPGTGGNATIGSGSLAIGIFIGGGSGTSAQTSVGTVADFISGGSGASSPFGGVGGGQSNAAGSPAQASSGSGGGGGGTGTGTALSAGTGGGAGGYIDAYIYNPAASYAFTVGSAGGGGGAGGTGFAGGAGGSGVIIVYEYYQ